MDKLKTESEAATGCEASAVERIVMFRRDAIVMANARRLIKNKKQMTNSQLYSELFGTGAGTAVKACVNNLGIDPDSKEASYLIMDLHINNIKT